MSKNFLTGQEAFTLRAWMIGHADQLKLLTVHQAAKRASEELAFNVTPNNLNGIKRDIGLTFTRKPPKKNSGNRPKRHNLTDVLVTLNGLGEAVAIMVKYQATILDQLGVKYGDDLAGLVKRIEDHQRAVQ